MPNGRDPAELVRNCRVKVLRHAVATNPPLAHAFPDITKADASIAPGNWQRALAIARQLFRTYLQRLPTNHVAGYVSHVAGRLHLDLEIATTAAADAVSLNAADPGSPEPARAAAASGEAGRV